MNAIYIAQCPFCGCVESYIAELPQDNTKNLYRVVCDDIECFAEGPLASTKESAVEKWNNRNIDSYYDEESARLTP